MEDSTSSKRTPPAANAAPPTTYIWRAQPDFGRWLRELREKRGISLRVLSAQTGLSYARLQRLESGGRQGPPSQDMMEGLALFYGVAIEEVLAQAGFRVDVPPDLKDAARCEASFERLVFHPKLRPIRMDDRFADSYSRLQKAQWVDFARKLDAHIRAGGAPLAELLRGC